MSSVRITHSTPGSSFLNFLGRNQDSTCLVICTKNKGVHIFSLEHYHTVREIDLGYPVSLASMLYCTSLLALVGSKPPASERRLSLYNSHSSQIIADISFPTNILSVHLSKQHLAVVLESKTQVYATETLEEFCTIHHPQNPKGVAALSISLDQQFLALPAHQTNGIIAVHDLSEREGQVFEIDAHKSGIAQLLFSDDGTLLASTSTKGTMIRVFGVADGQGTREFSFRRGTTPRRITSMAFSPSNRFLFVASDHGSVHVFRLAKPNGFQSIRAAARSVLAVMTPSKSKFSASHVGEKVARIELHKKKENGPLSAVVAVTGEENSSGGGGSVESKVRVAVATSEGNLYDYMLSDVANKGKNVSIELQGQWVFGR